VTRHQEIVIGGLIVLLVVIVALDRLLLDRVGSRVLDRLPEADRAVF
jgi:hypothetical protein